MFQLKPYEEPAEPSFPHDLAALGLSVTSDGHVVDAEGSPFPRRPHRNERLSLLHFEAIRGGSRDYVMERCLEHEVKQIFIRGADILDADDEQPSVRILTSDTAELKDSSVVVVLIGPSTGDLGVFSHFNILHGSGIYKHSILGFLKQLSDRSGREDAKSSAENVPGLIVLNPGQLIYSHKHRTTFSRRSWLARPLAKGQREPFTVHPDFNLIPGHENAYAHIKTSFEHLIPKLVHHDASLCIIAIGDTTGVTLNVLDDMLVANPKHAVGRRLSMTFLMQPNHGYNDIHSPLLRQHLAMYAQAFVMDEHPTGTLLQKPPHFMIVPKQYSGDRQKHRARARPKMRLPVASRSSSPSKGDQVTAGQLESDGLDMAGNQKDDDMLGAHTDQQERDQNETSVNITSIGEPLRTPSNLLPVTCNNDVEDDVSCVTLSAGPGVVNPEEMLTTPSIVSHVLDLLYDFSTGSVEAR